MVERNTGRFAPGNGERGLPADADRVQAQLHRTLEQIRAGEVIPWGSLESPVLRGVITAVATSPEIGVPPSMMVKSDYTKRIPLLGGRSLSGFYKHAMLEARKAGVDSGTYTVQRAGLTITADDVQTVAELGRDIPWRRIVNDTDGLRSVLDRMSEETGVPVSLFAAPDFQDTRYAFLNNKIASGILFQYKSRLQAMGDTTTSPAEAIKQELGITPTVDEVIVGIDLGRDIPWRSLEAEARRDMLTRAAREIHEDLPPSMLFASELNRPYEFLRGRSLNPMRDFDVDRDGQDTMSHVLQRAGITVTTEDLLTVFQLDREIAWARVPKEALRGLFKRVFGDKPLYTIQYTDMIRPSPVLNGRTLRGLWNHIRDNTPADMTPLQHLMERSGGNDDYIADAAGRSLSREFDPALVGDIQSLLDEGVRSPSAIAEILGLAQPEVRPLISFMIEHPLMRRQGGREVPIFTRGQIDLGPDDPLAPTDETLADRAAKMPSTDSTIRRKRQGK